MKKAVYLKILLPLVSLVFVISVSVSILAGILGAVSSSNSDCSTEVSTSTSTTTSVSSGDGSIDSFVKEHKEAYILSWKAGGFLPSASITQTMIENGFNFSNPNGTSFWQAHNMGGVKTSSKDNFPVTLATYGENSVDLSGTKPGANVGDGTGGAYTWFASYDAGIVGKAEFMAHQSLYTKAINNTDGVATLSAIADGGWATDGTYKTKLVDMYNTIRLGKSMSGWTRKRLVLMEKSLTKRQHLHLETAAAPHLILLPTAIVLRIVVILPLQEAQQMGQEQFQLMQQLGVINQMIFQIV